MRNTNWREDAKSEKTRANGKPPDREPYHSTDAAAADGGLEFAVQLLDGAGGVKALSQEDDPIQEEKGSDAVDDILHQLYSVKEQRRELQASNLPAAMLRKLAACKLFPATYPL